MSSCAERPTVLLIDDDSDTLTVLECALAGEGFDSIRCRSPEEGLRLVFERPVDCVLLDIHFAHTPECLGFLSAMGSLPGRVRVPIVTTSAMVDPAVVRHALRLGARRFIAKPFYPREIIQEMRTLFPSVPPLLGGKELPLESRKGAHSGPPAQ